LELRRFRFSQHQSLADDRTGVRSGRVRRTVASVLIPTPPTIAAQPATRHGTHHTIRRPSHHASRFSHHAACFPHHASCFPHLHCYPPLRHHPAHPLPSPHAHPPRRV